MEAPNTDLPAKLEGDELTDRNFEMSLDGDHYILASAKVNDLVDAEIPSTYRGLPVTTIAGHAFENHTEMVSLKTPECINEMGMEAFLNCSALKEVTMEKYPQKMNIHPYDGFTEREDAFFGCTSIETLTINSGVVGSAFMAAQMDDSELGFSASLKNISLGNEVSEIGDHAFGFSLGLTSISIPDKVTKIGGSAFYACLALTSIKIPGNVTSIGDQAFYWCTSLASIEICEGVEVIEGGAFSDCAITEISLPSTIKEVGRGAFGCDSLQTANFAKGIDWEAIPYGIQDGFGNVENAVFNVYVADNSLDDEIKSKFNYNGAGGARILNIIVVE